MKKQFIFNIINVFIIFLFYINYKRIKLKEKFKCLFLSINNSIKIKR